MTSQREAAILQVRDLSFSYPAHHVFTHWSADFKPGLTWLRGANGCGKSTLLKLIAGALPALTGRLTIAQIDATRHPLAYRREVFWCGPDRIPFDHLRAFEYFGFLRSLYPRFDMAALPSHVQAFGLDGAVDVHLREMSTGTQRKVWLAAALAARTRVVLLDEPLNALDGPSLASMVDRLASCAADTQGAWIVASHAAPGEVFAKAVAIDLDQPSGAG